MDKWKIKRMDVKRVSRIIKKILLKGKIELCFENEVLLKYKRNILFVHEGIFGYEISLHRRFETVNWIVPNNIFEKIIKYVEKRKKKERRFKGRSSGKAVMYASKLLLQLSLSRI